MKYIFEEIVETRVIFKIIDESTSDVAEKGYLNSIVKDTFHHKIVDLILDELDEEKRLAFLAVVDDEEKHLSIIEQLKEWIVDFETKLSARIKETEEELFRVIGLN